MNMYTEHFNLNLLPFENVPDPLFFYDYGDHALIRKQISGSLHSGRGLIVVIGPIGSGKTTLSQMIKFDFPENIKLIWMGEPPANSTNLYLFIAQELGLQPSSTEKTFVLRDIRNALLKINSEGKKCLIIMDESHLISDDVINGIRLLNNLEEGSIKLIQLLLLGQEELMETINRPEMEPFKQRIATLEILGKMNVDTVLEYVSHRIQVAGGTPALISDTGWEALSVAFSTGGTPRTINSLCDRSFNVAFEREKSVVDARDIYEATQRMGLRTDVFHYICLLNTREREIELKSQESQLTADKPVPETAEQPAPSITGKAEQSSRETETVNEVPDISAIRMGVAELSPVDQKGLKVPVTLLVLSIVALTLSVLFFYHRADSTGFPGGLMDLFNAVKRNP
ncbi:MAG: AAA family ATPase [Methylobacter sp.]|nr:AAA family ATPase [Methylobacter sp.]